MLRAAGLPRASRLAGLWERAAASPALESGVSWERIPSFGGRRAQLRIPRPGSCLASSRLCRSGRRALALACPFVGISHPFILPQAKISILAAGWHAQAAAFSWFVFVFVELSVFFLSFCFLCPLIQHSHHIRSGRAGCGTRVVVTRAVCGGNGPFLQPQIGFPGHWELPGELMFPSIHPGSSDPLWG